MSLKIFISHTRDSADHHYEVESLAKYLSFKGNMTVVYDCWDTPPPRGWDAWVNTAVRQADFVLVICSSVYYEKVLHDQSEVQPPSWSGPAMRHLLFNNKFLAHKWVPVLLTNGQPKHILSPLKRIQPIPVKSVDQVDFLVHFIQQAHLLVHNPRETTQAPRSPIGRILDMFKEWLPTARSTPSHPPPSPRITGNSTWDDLMPNKPQLDHAISGGDPNDTAESAPEAPPSPAPISPFQKGTILYAIPDQMMLGKSTLCRIRIAPEMVSQEALEDQLTEDEKEIAKRESLDISPVMRVILEEAGETSRLSITARNSPEQPVLPFRPTEWGFDITPSTPGHCALILRVSAKIQVPGFGERPFDVSSLNRAILVTTTGDMETASFVEQPIPDPTWDEGDEIAVNDHLNASRADKAIERLANFLQDKDTELYDKLIMLQWRWNDNTNQLNSNRISAKDWDLVNSKVRFALLGVLKVVREAFPLGDEPTTVDWQPAYDLIEENL